MIAPSLHPESVRAQAVPRGRFAYGLTQRTIWLLVGGLLLALPGFFDARLAYAMLVWDAIVLLAAFADFLRLPPPRAITLELSWSNAPSLDSETEIELAVESPAPARGGTILNCSLTDDLPLAMVSTPATHKLRTDPV